MLLFGMLFQLACVSEASATHVTRQSFTLLATFCCGMPLEIELAFKAGITYITRKNLWFCTVYTVLLGMYREITLSGESSTTAATNEVLLHVLVGHPVVLLA